MASMAACVLVVAAAIMATGGIDRAAGEIEEVPRKAAVGRKVAHALMPGATARPVVRVCIAKITAWKLC